MIIANMVSSIHWKSVVGCLLVLLPFICPVIDYNKKYSRLTSVPQDIPVNVEKIDLEGNLLSAIPAECFSRYLNLTTVILTNNKIADISEDAFLGLPRMNTLFLSNNLLKQVPAIKDLEETLRSFYLGSNAIQDGGTVSLRKYVKLSHLDLSNNLLSVMPTDFSSDAPLKEMILEGNPITTVLKADFAMVQQLEVLDLRDADISDEDLADLMNLYFQGLHTLKALYLGSNKITAVPQILSDTFPSLQVLEISHNPLSSCASTVWPSLKEISIIGGEHFIVPEYLLDLMPNITTLRITGAEVTSIPQLTSVDSSVEYLDFSHNQITSLLPDLFVNCSSLQKLNLDDNKLTVIPNGVFGPANSALKFLYLSSNDLNLIETGALANLSSVEEFYIQNNKFTSFPLEVSSLVGVQRLYMSQNKITTVPPEGLMDLHELTHLNIAYNKLIEMPPLTTNHSRLRYLNLKSNKIKECSEDYFQNTPKLQYLNLEINKLTTIPNLTDLSKLGQFHAADNSINTIPDGFLDGLSSLTHLNLENNKLSTVNLEQYNLNITHLLLNNNPLTNFPGILTTGNSLMYLQLEECGLEKIPPEFPLSFEKLQSLHLDHNKLKNVPELTGMSTLNEVLLRDNAFECEQDICWMKTKDISSLGIVLDTYPCASPQALINTSWNDIDATMICEYSCTSVSWNNLDSRIFF